MVKEESEEEICGLASSSRANSRRSSRATSPSTSLLGLSSRVSPAAIQVRYQNLLSNTVNWYLVKF